MSDEQQHDERRHPPFCGLGALHEQRMANIEKSLAETRTAAQEANARVKNGLAKEIREEVAKEFKAMSEGVEARFASVDRRVSGMSNRLWAVMLIILVALAGLVIEGRYSANEVVKVVNDLKTELFTHTHNPATGLMQRMPGVEQ